MKYYIGADLGTSAMKLLLVDEEGRIVHTVSETYEVHFPRSGWSEQNPSDWWNALVTGVRKLIADVDANCVKGIGVGGQMHGLVVLDEQDAVIRPAILWNDGRTDKETAYLNEEIGKALLSECTGNIAFAGFTAPKILWMKNNEPENALRICKIMLPKDYLNYRLTGNHTTDYSDASGMLLLDVKNKCWSEQMLKICDVKKEWMPVLKESFEVVGSLKKDVASELGLTEDVIVVAGAGDNAAAAVGTGVVSEGKCNISLGTSGTIFFPMENFAVDAQNALHAFCHADGRYHLMGCILSAASCNKWFCEDILSNGNYEKLQADITEEKLGENDVFFLPYLMGERSPINDTDARGTFTGMTMKTSRTDMVQAVLEGVSFAIRDNFEVAKSQGISIEDSYLCGGGAKSKIWQRILCNVLNIPIRIPMMEEGPGYGAALLAMVGDGTYASLDECVEKFVKEKEIIYPDKEIASRYQRQYDKYKKIYPAMKELFKELKRG